jgi:hypothetical protein
VEDCRSIDPCCNRLARPPSAPTSQQAPAFASTASQAGYRRRLVGRWGSRPGREGEETDGRPGPVGPYRFQMSPSKPVQTRGASTAKPRME